VANRPASTIILTMADTELDEYIRAQSARPQVDILISSPLGPEGEVLQYKQSPMRRSMPAPTSSWDTASAITPIEV
jgi:hypothetical protein